MLLIIDYSTKNGVLVYSRKCASEIEYKDKGSIFFQSLCEIAILLFFSFLYSWAEKMSTSFLAVEI